LSAPIGRDVPRRDFLRQGAAGLAAAGTAALLLSCEAKPTEPSGDAGAYGRYATEKNPGLAQTQLVQQAPGGWKPTEDNILGPFYRPASPYRAKITPPLEPGTLLLIRGRVWAFDSRRPLAMATLDIWQANAHGRYDNDDPQKPPAKDLFLNRARLVTDENGFYEFETIHPGPYQTAPNVWRPSHIHYMVQYPGYKTLVTQLYFKGDPHNATDEFIKASLIIDVKEVKLPQGTYQAGAFDIILAKA